ncbi:MAG: hypothetical protein AABX66_03440 [Nanoarchaeota archaeon]
MDESYSPQSSIDLISKIRDIEEKQRLVKDRMILIGKTVIDERNKNFKDIQELKKTVLLVKEENLRIKELLARVTEQLSNCSRKEELAIIQRQLDLLRH